MNGLILAINPGSSSIKFGLFDNQNDIVAELYRGAIKGIGSTPTFTIKTNNHCNTDDAQTLPPLTTKEDSYAFIVQWLSDNVKGIKITQVCYRLVHGGDKFSAAVTIDESVLKTLTSFIPLAPLHQPLALKAISVFMKKFPQALHIACFDTAFHRAMPEISQTFALPRYLHKQGIKPYGFHGLSFEYITQKMPEINAGKTPNRMVIAHLGSGASMCALREGESIATSMTFSPLDGLPMASRSGNIDANAVLYMIDQLNFSSQKVSEILNNQSGLLGLSGLSGDVEVLIKSTNDNAKFALDFFIHQVCRELGAMIATLQGLDALVFTGGIGSNSDEIRKRVCEQFEWFGISLETSANNRNEILISTRSSSIDVFSIKTDEELMMAQQVSTRKN